MSAWNDLVSKIFKENKSKNSDYKLKDAMIAAKKVYKKPSASTTEIVKKTRKTRKSKKSRKSRKSIKSRKN